MPINVSYLTYEFTDNPNEYPEYWIAEARENDDPGGHWETVTLSSYLALLADQREEFILFNEDAVEFARRSVIVDAARESALATIHALFDDSGMVRVLSWLTDDTTPPNAKTKILGVQDWADAVMYLYLAIYKPAIMDGGSVALDYASVGSCPYTFTDIFNAATTPEITVQPTNKSGLVTTSVTFSLTAVCATLEYQWQKAESGTPTSFSNISGATNSSYQKTNLQYADDGDKYRCVVTGPGGSVTSNSVNLDVTP